MSSRLRGFIAGAVFVLLVGAVAGYIAVKGGLVPANADSRPPRIERWASSTSLHAMLARLPKQNNPVAATDKNLIAGVKLYAQHCAVCHGDSSGTPSAIAKGLYVRAPQLGKDGVEDDPDQIIYWKVAHGLRWTGMPAFAKSLNDTQLWQITAFLKTMDHLPPAADRVWRQVKSGRS